MQGGIRALRTMRRGEVYDIEEKIGSGKWTPICECNSIHEAKEMLKTLKILDKEEVDEEDKS